MWNDLDASRRVQGLYKSRGLLGSKLKEGETLIVHPRDGLAWYQLEVMDMIAENMSVLYDPDRYVSPMGNGSYNCTWVACLWQLLFESATTLNI